MWILLNRLQQPAFYLLDKPLHVELDLYQCASINLRNLGFLTQKAYKRISWIGVFCLILIHSCNCKQRHSEDCCEACRINGKLTKFKCI